MKENRHPFEVRKVGKVAIIGPAYHIHTDDDKWFPLPCPCLHMLGTRAEVIVRQLPDLPSAES